jgi:hypothetical protein
MTIIIGISIILFLSSLSLFQLLGILLHDSIAELAWRICTIDTMKCITNILISNDLKILSITTDFCKIILKLCHTNEIIPDNLSALNTLNYLNRDISKVVIPPKGLEILKECIDNINSISSGRNYKLIENDIKNANFLLYKNNLKTALIRISNMKV